MKTGDSFRDYPIVDKYKYLGTWLSQKLMIDPQIEFIEKKVNLMKHKLSPLHNATLDLRKILCQIFVVPLFEFTFPTYFYEESLMKKGKLEQVLRNSFKKFTGLGKGVDTCLIEELMGYNLENRSCHIQYISEKKWESRLVGERYVPSSDSNQEFARPPIKPYKCKYFSKKMVKYINLQSALCPKCKN